MAKLMSKSEFRTEKRCGGDVPPPVEGWARLEMIMRLFLVSARTGKLTL